MPPGAAGAPVSFVELAAPFGHDSFLLDVPALDGEAGAALFSGNALPDGNYQFKANAVVGGRNTSPTVSVMSTVQSIQTGSDGSLRLIVQGGQSVALNKVTTITQ